MSYAIGWAAICVLWGLALVEGWEALVRWRERRYAISHYIAAARRSKQMIDELRAENDRLEDRLRELTK